MNRRGASRSWARGVSRPRTRGTRRRRMSMCAGLFLGVVLGGCTSEPGPGPEREDPGSEATATPAPVGPIIDPALSPGDTVGDWRVTAADLHPVEGQEATWVGEVRFSGVVQLSGARRPHPSDPEPEAVCFFPDSLSSARLPRLAGDERTSWFCFSNPEAATGLDLDPSSGSAQTITINEYRYIFSFSDVFNTARLASVDRNSSP